MRLRSLSIAAALTLWGCGKGTPTYHRDVAPLVSAKCAGCHQSGGIAPFAFASYADVKSYAPLITKAVQDRVMPPWLAAPGCAQYADDRSLSDAQISTLTEWVAAGTPEGSPNDKPAQVAGDTGGLSRVDLKLQLAAPYTPQLTPDDYRCFVLDWPYSADAYVTGFRAVPGNAAEVHHVIAYLAQPADVPKVMQLAGTDPDASYTCFGGAGLGRRTSWIGAWAPGSLGNDFPSPTGIRISPGSKIVLQVHYNTSSVAPAPDQTAIEMKIDPSVELEAYVQPFTDPDWVGTQAMKIPAGAADVSYHYALDPTPYMGVLSHNVVAGGSTFKIYSALLHMHTRGTRAQVAIDRQDGSTECMLDIEHWNFHWQGSYGFPQPKLFHPGDQLYLECHWDNTAAHQPIVGGVQVTPTDLYWGEGTGDEMCLGGFYIAQ